MREARAAHIAEMDRSVDTGAGIPAGIRLVTVVDDYLDLVAVPGTYGIVEIDDELAVGADIFPDLHPVYADDGVALDAFEQQLEMTLVGVGRRRPRPGVHVAAAREISTVHTAGRVCAPRLPDHRVVRQGDGFGGRVVDTAKGPAVIETRVCHSHSPSEGMAQREGFESTLGARLSRLVADPRFGQLSDLLFARWT
nr:hypothetical protein [Nocardia salmonicida]